MENKSFKKEKEKEENPEQEVFRIHIDEIKKRGVTQCQKHVWRKLDDNNLECINCPTAIIVNPEVLEQYL